MRLPHLPRLSLRNHARSGLLRAVSSCLLIVKVLSFVAVM